MSARVVVDGLESEPFDDLVGVEQGCVLAPVIFRGNSAGLVML